MRRNKYGIRSGRQSFSGVISALTENMLHAAMRDGSLLLIDGDGRGITVLCAEGAACLTQPCDPKDHILHSGETFIIDRKGLVAVTALTNARIRINISPDRMTAES
ncbi:MAG: hypothetical protein HZA17_02095 [Nitrospirae bacterium]|nr:hypothetical protein [Nitrospirota bacterium]